jgi:predicted ABC-type ATPase
MYVSQNDLQGLSEYEFRDLFQKQLNLPSKQLRNIFLARNTGKNIEIELPAGDTVSIVDRPYWAKIKGLFKIKPFAEVVSTPAGIKARQEVLLLQAKERFVSPSVVAPAQKLLPPPVQKVRELAKAIPETIDINTPERQMLRQGIIDKFSMKGTEDKEKIVDIVLGLPASGKNAYIAKPLSEATNALLIDSDIYKKELPEYNKGIGAEATHKESSDIIESSITEKAVSSGVNIVLPRLGKNYNTIKNLIEAFKEKGYTVNLHFVDLPTEKAVARAEQRYWEGGNFVDPDFIRKLDLTLLENYDRLKLEKGVDSYGKYSTDVQKGEEAKLIESSSNYQPLRLRSRRLRDSSISKGREESEAPSEVISLPVSKPSALPLTDQDIAKIDQGIKPAINW